jgi:DNA ligase (NAD+)
MDIEGLGEQRVILLVDKGLIQDAGDIYSLSRQDLLGLEGFAELSVSNLLSAIESSKERTLDRLLVGLGIRHLGAAGARALARAFGHLDRIEQATEEELAAVEGIGPVIAASVARFFAADRNQRVLAKLRAAGVNLSGPAPPELPQTLEGRSVVVTGTLEGWSREEAEAAIKARGGRAPGSVSRSTFALVVGDAPGASKVERARQLGVPMIDEAGFARLLETGELGAGG